MSQPYAKLVKHPLPLLVAALFVSIIALLGVSWWRQASANRLSIMVASNNLGPTSGGTVTVVTGRGFEPGARVYFGSTLAGKVDIPESTTAVVTSPPHEAGIVSITLENPDGRRAKLAEGFRYNSQKPRITSIAPDRGPVAGGTLVTVNGSAFQASRVKVVIHGQSVPAAVQNDQTLNFVTPPATGPMEVNVQVSTPEGEYMSDSFNYFYE